MFVFSVPPPHLQPWPETWYYSEGRQKTPSTSTVLHCFSRTVTFCKGLDSAINLMRNTGDIIYLEGSINASPSILRQMTIQSGNKKLHLLPSLKNKGSNSFCNGETIFFLKKSLSYKENGKIFNYNQFYTKSNLGVFAKINILKESHTFPTTFSLSQAQPVIECFHFQLKKLVGSGELRISPFSPISWHIYLKLHCGQHPKKRCFGL